MVHRLVATLARHGVSAAAQEEKKGTKQRENYKISNRALLSINNVEIKINGKD